MTKLDQAKARFTRTLLLLAAFSFFINLLMLTMPLYMLQIYDRILPSQSLDTLTFLSIIAVAALAVLGMLDAVRGVIASRAALRLETDLGASALAASMLPGNSAGDIRPLRDLAGVRSYISSRGVLSLLDLPFSPFFIGILYFVHPILFWLTLGGALLLLGLAWFNHRATAKSSAAAQVKTAMAIKTAQSLSHEADTMRAMGMGHNGVGHWGRDNAEALNLQSDVDARAAILSGFSRTLRMILQIAILGVGAWLVLQGEMTAGMIFACSIISGRGLQPLDQVIGSWKQTASARESWEGLKAALALLPEERDRTMLDRPEGVIDVQNVTVTQPRGTPGDPILNRLSFTISAGDIVGIVGPSGSGKSTLARLLVGASLPSAGTIRIDGNELANWNPAQLGMSVGYLSQEVQLLPGSVKDNIARLLPNPDDAMVLEAARKAQVHDLIQGLPHGYDTQIGQGGFTPSVGQRQRIALARAFYGNPQIMVLDEPNANLDEDGEQALRLALIEARKSGATVILITQRMNILGSVEKVLRLHKGKVDFFGPVKQFVEAIDQARIQAQDPAKLSPAVAKVATSDAGTTTNPARPDRPGNIGHSGTAMPPSPFPTAPQTSPSAPPPGKVPFAQIPPATPPQGRRQSGQPQKQDVREGAAKPPLMPQQTGAAFPFPESPSRGRKT